MWDSLDPAAGTAVRIALPASRQGWLEVALEAGRLATLSRHADASPIRVYEVR